MEDSVTQSFQKFNEILTQENLIREDIRTAVRELEDLTRSITNVLQVIHHPNGLLKVEEITDKCSILLSETSSKLKNLSTKFDPQFYFKYHDHWRYSLQRLSFVVLFIDFLKNSEKYTPTTTNTPASTHNNDDNTINKINENKIDNENYDDAKFLSHEECAAILELGTDCSGSLHLELEDYLNGVLLLASELARLSTNAVTSGRLEWPRRIGRLVARIDQGFRLLNLKNDHLRRRYDALKYDLKRVEEVVYDLSIRGLE